MSSLGTTPPLPRRAPRPALEHLLAIADLPIDEMRAYTALGLDLKREFRSGGNRPVLAGRVLALLFERPSLRTRVSFEVAMHQLGGKALYLAPHEVELGKRESVGDVARVTSRYVDAMVLRTGAHSRLLEFAAAATVPVINGLSEAEHPCQALADILTMWEHRGALEGLRLAYIGDGNNVCASLIMAAAKMGMHVTVGSPRTYAPSDEIIAAARRDATRCGRQVTLVHDPAEAVRGADVIYTDVWVSMGQEREATERRAAFAGFQVNRALVDLAGDAVVMHCLPAHRGEEIEAEVLDGPGSIVLDQAENRMHAQKAVLHRLLA
ncbi:MAG: ornithine carbamoyltransferase [Chloroflexi bacterium]|nr:ornithine carbamoyltransferase [Chloroflexota bacterium]